MLAFSTTADPFTVLLDRRTRDIAVRAEYAAIPWLRPQLRPATGALIEELTGIGRHGLRLRGATVRASDDGFRDHKRYLKHGPDIGGSGRIGENSRYEIIDGEILPDRKREQINDFIGMRPDEVRAENAPAAFIDEHLVAVD